MARSGQLEDMGLKLITVARRYRRKMDAIFIEYGLSYASTLPLRFLARQERPYRQKELADILNIEGPTLVRVLDTLVAEGFVERSEDKVDRRAKLVSVTPKGHKFLESLADRMGELREQIFAGSTKDEIDATLQLLARLDHNMDQLEQSP